MPLIKPRTLPFGWQMVPRRCGVGSWGYQRFFGVEWGGECAKHDIRWEIGIQMAEDERELRRMWGEANQGLRLGWQQGISLRPIWQRIPLRALIEAKLKLVEGFTEWRLWQISRAGGIDEWMKEEFANN